MRPAPGFKAWPDPVDGLWKQDLLRWLGKIFDLRILVETGTCEGSTLEALRNDFEELHSVELSDRYFSLATNRLKDVPNVRLWRGDSRTILPKMIGTLPDIPLLFWLDAHPSAPDGAHEGDPLQDELETVMRLKPDSLIVVDDMRDAEFSHLPGLNLTGWVREYRTGEVVMHRGGYVIPPFEV